MFPLISFAAHEIGGDRPPGLSHKLLIFLFLQSDNSVRQQLRELIASVALTEKDQTGE